ncbi:UdgX family uracil-DNA binding protein [Novosphingobium sp. KCTC 2891]|uniref:UdgX family uracil-DNA binding protein n=1 Tax=Novosphingobium sp. KCTC 2891 TaxID=2989730 RepID=UPI002221B034|nr:UdgX family uracil-DNA binding protein [Novosphingobium sp. KCTC 2891]MCW1381677.1 UdgX family uracil-DNA binding protein [Novosphingobium sp. KCTC 2891]
MIPARDHGSGSAPGSGWVVSLAAPDDFDGWREVARQLLRAAIPPEQVRWEAPGGEGADLFAAAARPLPVPPADAPQPRVSRAFVQMAQSAILHGDSARFALLYRLLWRLQSCPRLMEDAADPDVRHIDRLARTVRRDIHKMRAFLRFRVVEEADGQERYVAWFEPEHHILRANAGVFVRRFTQMRWSILTPQGALHWDGEILREGPPAQRSDAPSGDPTEDLWRKYYASTFNPARLKVGAMLKEMPRKYWKNMPEAALIPELVAGAQAREARMVEAGSQAFGERPASLAEVASAIAACRRCAIGCNGTSAVPGEGPRKARLMIVGEQPGDMEEQAGRPFIGPAGQLLRAHLNDTGLDVNAAYVTNAVKHFKFAMTGKRRLHQSPTAGEIDTCRWWVESERALVQPRLILALGASAARAMLGRTVSVQKERGRPHRLEDGTELWITTHPSYLLRLKDDGRQEGGRQIEEARFRDDLRAVAARLRELA